MRFKRVIILLASICMVLFITACNDSDDGDYGEHLEVLINEHNNIAPETAKVTTAVKTTTVEMTTIARTEKLTEAKTTKIKPAVTKVKSVETTKATPAATKAKPTVTKPIQTTVKATKPTIPETEASTTEETQTVVNVGVNNTPAMELAKLSLAEIIALTGGNYTLRFDMICYVESPDVFPGMHFYTMIDDIDYSIYNQFDAVTDPVILSNLESGVIAYFHFEISDDDEYDANYGKEFSYSEMMERNPNLKNVVVRKEN